MVVVYYILFVVFLLGKCFLCKTDYYSSLLSNESSSNEGYYSSLLSNESSSKESLNYEVLKDDYGEMDLQYLRIGDEDDDEQDEIMDTLSSKIRK